MELTEYEKAVLSIAINAYIIDLQLTIKEKSQQDIASALHQIKAYESIIKKMSLLK